MSLRTHPLLWERRFLLMCAIVVFCYITLTGIGALRPVTDGFTFILRPLQRATASVGSRVSGWFGSFGQSDALRDENEALRTELARAVAENAQLRDQIDNSTDVGEQLRFLKPRQLQSTFSQIIGKSPTIEHETLLLDRGSADGVHKGAPVIVGEGILIGKILSVSANTSVALLITDGQSRIAALIQNEQRSPGEVLGERGIGLRMDLIPRQDSLAVGDTVVTSGLEPLIPQGLVIGRIAELTTKTGGIFHEALIEQIKTPTRLRIVSILQVNQQ